MRRARWGFILAASMLAACDHRRAPRAADRSRPASAPSGARAQTAAPPVPRGPPKLRVAAVFADEHVVRVDSEGWISIVAGGRVYEVRDGTIAPIAPLDAFTPAFPANAVPLSGFRLDGAIDPIWWVARGTGDRLHAFTQLARSFTLDVGRAGAQLSLTSPKSEVTSAVRTRGGTLAIAVGQQRHLVWLEGDPRPPPRPRGAHGDMSVAELAVGKDGTLAALGATDRGVPQVTVWRPNAALDAGERFTMPKSTPRADCRFISAFDGRVYLCCDEGDDFTRSPHLRRVDDGSFDLVFAEVAPSCHRGTAIDSSGTLFRTRDRTKIGTSVVERCPREATDGAPRCDVVEMDEAPSTLAVARYRNEFWGERDPAGRRWQHLEADRSFVRAFEVDLIVPRSPEDVWVFGGGVAYRLSTTPIASASSVVIPSVADTRVLLQNRAPSVPWSGRCASAPEDPAVDDNRALFVALGKGGDAPQIVARYGEITRTLGDRHRPPVAWSLVRGRLNDAPVVGVVAIRRDFDWSAADFTGAVDALVATFTDPISVPRVTCTLPVLDEILEPATGPKVDAGAP